MELSLVILLTFLDHVEIESSDDSCYLTHAFLSTTSFSDQNHMSTGESQNSDDSDYMVHGLFEKDDLDWTLFPHDVWHGLLDLLWVIRELVHDLLITHLSMHKVHLVKLINSIKFLFKQ